MKERRTSIECSSFLVLSLFLSFMTMMPVATSSARPSHPNREAEIHASLQVASASRAGEVDVSALGVAGPRQPSLRAGESFGRDSSPRSSNGSQPPYTLNVTTAFSGLQYGCNGAVYCTSRVPPDVQVASSSKYVLETVNSLGEIWNIHGKPVKTFSLASFFRTDPAEVIFDPRVTFDNSSQRWFAVAADKSNEMVRFAVSQGYDPAGGWWTYRFPLAPGLWPDQPVLGVSSDKLVISLNEYALSNDSFVGAEYWVLAKVEALAGSSLIPVAFGPDANLFSIHPARSTGSNDTIFMASVEEERGYVKFFRVEGLPAAPQVFTFERPVSAITPPPNATQFGTDFLVDAGGTRAMDALWGGGRLWLTFTDGCVPHGDSRLRSCIRLVQLDVDKEKVLQNFRLSAPGYFYFYPTISLDAAGNLVVGFGYSSLNDSPGLAVWAQPADAPSAIQVPITLQVGVGPTTPDSGSCRSGVCRYGDYFGSSIDLHGGGVWIAGEVSNSTGWSTEVANVVLRKILGGIPVTVDYGIVGGGSGYSPPVLTYSVSGEIRRDLLSTVPKTYFVDAGSNVNVTQMLIGSTQTERWLTNQPTTGVARTPLNITFLYSHQFAASFRWSVSDGSPGSGPMLNVSQSGKRLGLTLTEATNNVWADAGSRWKISSLLNGTVREERWSTDQTTNGTVSSPFSLVFSYVHQFLVSSTVSPVNSGKASPPTDWYDSGTLVKLSAAASPGWQFQYWMGDGLSSYSGSRGSVSISVSSPIRETAVLFPGVTIVSGSGGAVSYSFDSTLGTVNDSQSGTVYVPQGTTLSLSAVPSSPFTALHGWGGDATGSAETLVVKVSAPMNVRAEFGVNYLTAGILLALAVALGSAVAVRRRRRSRSSPQEAPAEEQSS